MLIRQGDLPMTDANTTTGRCLCGEVTFAFEGAPSWTCYCHCESCRRNCSAPVTAYLGLFTTSFRWTGTKPATYQSSHDVQRRFCRSCGTPMAFLSDRYPGEIHLYIASLDDPEAYAPKVHVLTDERLSWFETADDLPRKPGFGKARTDAAKP
jgi:hypothetical protein